MAAKELKIEGRSVRVSNLEKLMFPKAKFSKGDLINYYIQAASFVLPHIKNRPLTFKRYPNGVDKAYFYEKEAPSHTPSWVKTAKVKHSSKTVNYVMINDLPSLVWGANLANIELHPLLSKAPNFATPTHMVFDLDPGPKRDVLDCIELGFSIEAFLKILKLNVYPKFSGSKGLQLYVPINTPCKFETISAISKALAEKFTDLMPDRVVSKMTKSLRSNKILIDWSQNSSFKTTVAVYSLRAKNEIPYVSLPFSWSELKKIAQKGQKDLLFYEVKDALKRMKRKGDLFLPVLSEKQKVSINLLKQIESLSASKSAKSPKLLSEYKRKRDFSKTSEPLPKTRKSNTEPIFVIQKHQASHLHYDFRLEMQGVLKSWAVPKGLPMESGVRRLAMQVEDHPMDYANFEGTIPEGNYGGGTVMVWDYGTYSVPEGKATSGLNNGKLVVKLEGKKLKGLWHLIKDKRDERRWLLIMDKNTKIKQSKRMLDNSAISNRTLSQITKDNDLVWDDGSAKKKRKK